MATVGSNCNSNIPPDLLIDILARLPVRSLLRFMCVSKYWNHLIQSPNFITIHHNRTQYMLLFTRLDSKRLILSDPDPDRPSDRFVCKYFGYDIVSSDDEEFYHVTTSNRFAPIANYISSSSESENECECNISAGTPLNSDSGFYTEEIEDEAQNKEYALSVVLCDHLDDINNPRYEDIIRFTEIDGFGIVNHRHAITGPVNGLFLLYNGFGCLARDSDACSYHSLALWNPATTEFRILPSPDFSFLIPKPDCLYIFGFGLDITTNTYKVVWIPEIGSHDDDEPEAPTVAVHSLDTNLWRHFNALVPSVAQIYNSTSTYLNGTCYWLSLHMLDGQGRQRIKLVLFDMGNDKFRETHIPDDISPNFELHIGRTSLVVHNDNSVGLIVHNYINLPNFVLDSIEMLVMNQEEEGCWSKLFNIGLGPHLRVEKALGFWKNLKNQILFMAANTNELVLYDSDTDTINHLAVQYDVDVFVHYSPAVFNYKESLVSIGGQKKCCKRKILHAMVQDFLAFQPTSS